MFLLAQYWLGQLSFHMASCCCLRPLIEMTEGFVAYFGKWDGP